MFLPYRSAAAVQGLQHRCVFVSTAVNAESEIFSRLVMTECDMLSTTDLAVDA
jgi:hypothetical protein